MVGASGGDIGGVEGRMAERQSGERADQRGDADGIVRIFPHIGVVFLEMFACRFANLGKTRATIGERAMQAVAQLFHFLVRSVAGIGEKFLGFAKQRTQFIGGGLDGIFCTHGGGSPGLSLIWLS
jgi:hypothetical protein